MIKYYILSEDGDFLEYMTKLANEFNIVSVTTVCTDTLVFDDGINYTTLSKALIIVNNK